MTPLLCRISAYRVALAAVLVFTAGCEPGPEGACSEGDSCTTTTSSGGPEPTAAFSKLPPYGVVGAEWVYKTWDSAGDVRMNVCRIASTFTWPDDQPGSTDRCVLDGDIELAETRFALYPDRIEAREVGDIEYEPPADAYRVPLEVGDWWKQTYELGAFGERTETWEVLAEEHVDVEFGSFDAAKVELRAKLGTSEGGLTFWWVDGIGNVKTEENGVVISELVSFEVP